MEGGLNTYAYVGGNPLYWIDPYGLEASVLPGAIPGVKPNVIPGWVRPPNPWWALFWPSPIGDGTLYPDGYPPYWNEEGDDGGQCPPEDDYPENPDDWVPPEGWTETPAGEKTGGRHRQWKDKDGKTRRRWDKEGDPVRQPGMGPHWWDDRFPKKHIFPNR